MQREYGVELRWSVFPLHPETPAEGMELAELFAGREEMIRDMQARLLQLAAEEGLPLMERTRTCNSRLAQELGKWAESLGQGDIFRRAIYRAYFAQGINIGMAEELLRIVADVGLPPKEAGEALAARSFAPAVDADWQRGAKLGVTAVPTHICGSRRLTGFNSYDAFVRLIS